MPDTKPVVQPTGRVLIPVDEQHRREIKVEIVNSLSKLFAVDPNMPIRHDPPKHIPRQINPRYFHNYGKVHTRIINKRKVYQLWSRD